MLAASEAQRSCPPTMPTELQHGVVIKIITDSEVKQTSKAATNEPTSILSVSSSL